MVAISGYSILRRDRNTRGGGVALFIHDSVNAKVISTSSGDWSGKPGIPEYIFCELWFKGGNPLIIALVYGPPHAPFLRDNNSIPQLLSIMPNYGCKVILGDFNADQLSDFEDAKFLRGLLGENSLELVPYGATNHTKSSDSWLDLCMIDEQDNLTDFWETDVPFIDGHDLITATIDTEIVTEKLEKFSSFGFKSFDDAGLVSFLQDYDWSSFVSDNTTLDNCMSCLYNHLNEGIRRFVTMKTVDPGGGRHPWYIRELRALITERDRFYRRFRRARRDIDPFNPLTAWDNAHTSIESARLDYYYGRLSSLPEARSLGKELRNLGLL